MKMIDHTSIMCILVREAVEYFEAGLSPAGEAAVVLVEAARYYLIVYLDILHFIF
jgi:hypothetical protein